MTGKENQSKPMETTFKYVSAWKKQPDGTWKIVMTT